MRRWCARSALPRNGGRGEIRTGSGEIRTEGDCPKSTHQPVLPMTEYCRTPLKLRGIDFSDSLGGAVEKIRKNNNPLPQMILRQGVIVWNQYRYYIIPPSGIAGAGVGSGMSTIPHSVVRNIPATEAAFSRATRLTLVGSMTPASNILTYSSVRAL